MDPITIASALGGLKPAFDSLRSVLGLLKDAKDLLPAGEKSAAIAQALATAESSTKLAEAEVAKALGFELCKCEFPPTPMLTVGYHTRSEGHRPGDPVFECPKCGINTAGPWMYERTAPERNDSA
ncbi:hypothetical protein [Bradyrhizobium sp. NBAIM08]|uniref:hypothetical protein n=1 Tax=Bradyrhizobium sp. NBAIM08 TaxID=2793815 RepID=UPI001CD3521A|nr:hypothetical protein [Bradyrhizobium sp. NBAIM08]MCA1474783.1 hypothetical protein [Bradyrhizobium sp. NBAIM08]